MTPRSRLAVGASVALLALQAVCTSVSGGSKLALSDEQWRGALVEHGIDPDLLSNPLAFTPEMQRAARKLTRGGTANAQLRELQEALFDTSRFPFDYASTVTVTAQEAFEKHEGNCVSFTNLFIALARSLGIVVRAALVPQIQHHTREEELIVVNQHVVAVFPNSMWTLVFDFDRTRSDPPRHYTLVDDLRVAALYANNLGVDRLREGKPAEALPLLDAATRLAPDYVDALSNLGVARRQVGDLVGAGEAYGRALELSPENPRVLKNLGRLYLETGHREEAYQALEAASMDAESPFIMLVRGDLERLRGNLDLALTFYSRAHRRDPDLVEPFIGQARVYLERGDIRAAQKALRNVLKRDPENPDARELEVEIEQSGPPP